MAKRKRPHNTGHANPENQAYRHALRAELHRLTAKIKQSAPHDAAALFARARHLRRELERLDIKRKH